LKNFGPSSPSASRDQLPTTMKVASRVSTNNRPFLVRMTVATLRNFRGKTIIPALPFNFSIFQRRTRSTVQRLSRSPKLLQTYVTFINDQLEKGFIEKIPDPTPTSNSHYIPHHPVRKISFTTPIRVVYDCSRTIQYGRFRSPPPSE
jgi:hypothetical protein